jgi:hypothetical protein
MKGPSPSRYFLAAPAKIRGAVDGIDGRSPPGAWTRDAGARRGRRVIAADAPPAPGAKGGRPAIPTHRGGACCDRRRGRRVVFDTRRVSPGRPDRPEREARDAGDARSLHRRGCITAPGAKHGTPAIPTRWRGACCDHRRGRRVACDTHGVIARVRSAGRRRSSPTAAARVAIVAEAGGSSSTGAGVTAPSAMRGTPAIPTRRGGACCDRRPGRRVACDKHGSPPGQRQRPGAKRRGGAWRSSPRPAGRLRRDDGEGGAARRELVASDARGRWRAARRARPARSRSAP